MKYLTLVISAIILSGCVSGRSLMDQNIALTDDMSQETEAYFQKNGKEATIEAGKEAVRSLLKDPNSAEFSDMSIEGFRTGRLVCGVVNAKNSFGGYVGRKPFAASPSIARIYEDHGYEFINASANFAITQVCRK